MHLATLVTCAKNEGPFFWEWVAHHRSIGFDKIVVYQNDSDDLSHAILKALEGVGAIRYFYNEAAPNEHQIQAYQRCIRLDEYTEAEWVMALDLDEFLAVKVGDGMVSDLVDALPECDQAFIN